MPLVDHRKNIIEVSGISFSYGDKAVLENVSLAVHQGDYLGLIGPNGAGKTTLLKIMLGLLRPAAGEVRFFGRKQDSFREHGRLAYVPQKAVALEDNFPATVREIVSQGRQGRHNLGRRLKPADWQAVDEALEQAGLADQRNDLISSLSGGQQQRAMIARALSSRPDVIFLDEPTSNIDHASQEELYRLLGRLNREQGLTLVLVSHDIARITKEAMHIACLDGRLVCHNSPAEFLADSELLNVYGDPVKVIGHHHHN